MKNEVFYGLSSLWTDFYLVQLVHYGPSVKIQDLVNHWKSEAPI